MFQNQVEFVLKYILKISHFTKYSYNLHGVWLLLWLWNYCFYSCCTTQRAMAVRIGTVRLTGFLEGTFPPEVSGDTEKSRSNDLLLLICTCGNFRNISVREIWINKFIVYHRTRYTHRVELLFQLMWHFPHLPGPLHIWRLNYCPHLSIIIAENLKCLRNLQNKSFLWILLRDKTLLLNWLN